MNVYPLIFKPIFKPRIWGGRRLESLLCKPLPQGAMIGESWEIADLEDDQSVVANGSAAGQKLGALVREWGTSMTGRAQLVQGRFPLLIKFLDARQTLSVQVHPDAATAAQLGGRARLKHEAWYVIDAAPEAFIYRGLREGVGPEELKDAIRGRRLESLLIRIPVRRGHAYFLPSGTIHALGAGVTVAEVQTPSDTTYRLYDWDRVDPATNAPRPLHIEEATGCISFGADPIPHENPQHLASVWTSVTSLIRSDAFVMERVRMIDGVEQAIPYDEMVIWIVLEGRGTIRHNGSAEGTPFGVGDVVLLPAGLSRGRVQTHDNCMWLEVSVPIVSSLTGFNRPKRESPAGGGGTAWVSLNVPDRDTGPSA